MTHSKGTRFQLVADGYHFESRQRVVPECSGEKDFVSLVKVPYSDAVVL